MKNYPDSCMSQLMYRTAKDYHDYAGGRNQYVRIGNGMSVEMEVY